MPSAAVATTTAHSSASTASTATIAAVSRSFRSATTTPSRSILEAAVEAPQRIDTQLRPRRSWVLLSAGGGSCRDARSAACSIVSPSQWCPCSQFLRVSSRLPPPQQPTPRRCLSAVRDACCAAARDATVSAGNVRCHDVFAGRPACEQCKVLKVTS